MGRILRFGLLGFGACAIISLAIVALVFGLTQPVVDGGAAFFAALKDGRSDDAYAMFTDSLAQEVSQTDFRGLFDGVDVGDWTVNSRQIRNGIGSLEGSVFFDGQEYRYLLRFLNISGAWMIDAYRFEDVN